MARQKPETIEARRHAEFEAAMMERYRFGERLVRRHAENTEKWRTCSQPVCRRQRACIAARVPCWDKAEVAEQLHSNDPLVRGVARFMSSFTGAFTWRMAEVPDER
jgi:hypothetical protein